VVEKFYRELSSQRQSGSDFAPFTLYGSGDFHYLSGLLIRRITEPFVLVSFDNHPDWAITPPKWACGGWINRALDHENLQHVAIWGCGNFECWWPHNIFANRKDQRTGRLQVHPWADDRPPKDRQRPGAILRENWHDQFEKFAAKLDGSNVYVTIDLDCLRADDAATNWENGEFSVADVEWALGKLREPARIVGGDICGAYSTPKYARRKQKFASNWDHPKMEMPNPAEIRQTNFETLKRLWPSLVNGTL
jgi:hypothetical protein